MSATPVSASTASPDSVVRAIRSCFTKFPQVDLVLSMLERLYASNCDLDEPENILLLGDSGVGKSTILEYVRDM